MKFKNLIFIISLFGCVPNVTKFENREPMLYRGITIAFIVLLGGLIWSNQVDPSKANEIINPSEKSAPLITTESSKQKIDFANFFIEKSRVKKNKIKICVVGLTYKYGVADTRNSQKIQILKYFRKKFKFTKGFDPFLKSSDKSPSLQPSSYISSIASFFFIF